MTRVQVVFYQDHKGVPVLDWLRELRKKDRKAYAKCVARIHLLEQWGHDLRRPLADYLEEDIYELRIRKGQMHYRILYFFHGQQAAVLAHVLIKEDRVPRIDLERAVERRKIFLKNPTRHRYQEEFGHG
jgi:phage-related protein